MSGNGVGGIGQKIAHFEQQIKIAEQKTSEGSHRGKQLALKSADSKEHIAGEAILRNQANISREARDKKAHFYVNDDRQSQSVKLRLHNDGAISKQERDAKAHIYVNDGDAVTELLNKTSLKEARELRQSIFFESPNQEPGSAANLKRKNAIKRRAIHETAPTPLHKQRLPLK